MKLEVKKIKRGGTNICFDCKNAVPDSEGHGCPWSIKFEPVPGWTAEPVIIGSGKSYFQTPTFHITECPLFDPDDDLESRVPKKTHPIKVRCVETGVVFPSVMSAARALGKSDSSINDALKTGRNYAYGYHWEKVEENDEEEAEPDQRRTETAPTEHHRNCGVVNGAGGCDREAGMAVIMGKLEYSEMKLEEAKRCNDDIAKEYWLGYIDGLRAAIRKEKNNGNQKT